MLALRLKNPLMNFFVCCGSAMRRLTYLEVPLHEPPLMKLEYVRLGPTQGLLGIAIHHLACDAIRPVEIAHLPRRRSLRA